MIALLSGAQALRTSAALVVAGVVLSGPAAMVVVAHVSPQPAWTGVSVFADHYHPVQALPYLLGYILLSGFVLFSASCHALTRGGGLEEPADGTGRRLPSETV